MGILDIFRIKEYKNQIDSLKKSKVNLEGKLSELGSADYFQVQVKISELKDKLQLIETEFSSETHKYSQEINRLKSDIQNLSEKEEKLNKQVTTQTNKLYRTKELYKSIEYAVNNFFNTAVRYEDCVIPTTDSDELENLVPSIILKLHCMDVKDLRKAYRDNEKQINKLLEQYSNRYTTKANKSIYDLMVISLRAELQNILYNLKYEKLETSIELLKNISAKYLKIAADGNQSIAGTLTKFIGEMEYLFINAIKIEYNYYVKKEQARQEQLAIREQMRQETEERKALELEKKKVEKEELKYRTEIEKLQDIIKNDAPAEEIEKLQARILELEGHLSDVILKKEDIANLQNGKAGNVYIISNLGSFGENVFKIGMTRRLDPQERVNELGSASVPFKFDVHSFIFSEDAVGLEKKLHETLNSKRLNKVNLRKEFFDVNITELEELVLSVDPTSEFKNTMLAEEYRQSLSSDDVYTSEYEPVFNIGEAI